MQQVLHNAEHTRAAFEIERISEKIKRYVQSDAYSKAIEILDKENFVIIAGQPGVGKTTLADMLVYAYAKENFMPIVVNASIEEARKLYTPGEKQIFYYDDFLGATFLDEQHVFIGANNDRDLLKFIDMVRRSKTAKLILTTREHILSQALRISERLSMEIIVDSKCIIEVSSYTRLQKAHMLYNHIYFSELPENYIEILLNEKFYLHIIDHTKFNPRVIEWLCSYQRVKKVQPAEFHAFVIKLLADPAQIWRSAYDLQISESARSMLLSIHSLGTPISIEEVFAAFDPLIRHRAKKYNYFIRPEAKVLAMSEICDSFILSKNGKINYINPSVADLMNYIIREAPENGLDIIHSAQKFSQLLQVWRIAEADGGECLKEHFRKEIAAITPIICRLIERPVFEKKFGKLDLRDTEFDVRLIWILELADFCESESILPLIQRAFKKLPEYLERGAVSVIGGLRAYEALQEAKSVQDLLGDSFATHFKSAILEALMAYPTSEELSAVTRFVARNGNWEGGIPTIQNTVQDYLENTFPDELHACNDTDECEELRQSIQYVADFFCQDLSQELRYIREKEVELQKIEEEPLEEIGGRHFPQGGVSRDTSDEVASMFESLKSKSDES